MEQPLDLDTTGNEIILAAGRHDLSNLRSLLKKGTANFQDPDTGYTALHAAVAACEDEKDGNAGSGSDEQAVDTLRLLFENGAIWNDLDHDNETPGCIALRLHLRKAYEMIVDAGVRAELLLNRLDDYEPLEDEDDMHDSAVQEENGTEDNEHIQQHAESTDVTSSAYLSSKLDFKTDRLLDADDNGVMMAWETDIMQQSSDKLVPEPGLRILNIGHGMGIIDKLFQEKGPSSHHIVEAHPQVVERMRSEGWQEKPGVTIHDGRWQDVLPKLAASGETFDAIYFDTFAEDYKAFQHFFSEHVIALLDPDGRFSFFHGMGADRQVCYDVYTKVAEMDLFEAGFDTEWTDIDVPALDDQGEWNGVKRPYWTLSTYRLPLCTFMS